MNELKFHAWDKVEEEMITDPARICWSFGEWSITRIDHDTGDTIEECNDPKQFEILPYIGTNDPDGKEIYKGDILFLQYESIQMVGYVKQKEDGGWIFYKDEENFLGVHHNKDRIKNIGNKYQDLKYKTKN